MPAEGREAAICHGLCPVLCLVSLVAAVLWIMTPVGRWDAVWQPCWARLPGRSGCLNIRLEMLNFSSKEQWSWSPGGEEIWNRSTVKTPNWLFYYSIFLWGLRKHQTTEWVQQCRRCQWLFFLMVSKVLFSWISFFLCPLTNILLLILFFSVPTSSPPSEWSHLQDVFYLKTNYFLCLLSVGLLWQWDGDSIKEKSTL